MSDHLIAEANRHARALIIERDQIRTELALLREWQREVIQNANAHHAERREAIARAERAEAELAAERQKVRVLRDACESICEEWGDNYNTNPFGAGNRMDRHATAALEATEGPQ